MDELITEFIVEAGESLETVDAELVRFEADPSDKAILNSIFRVLHTIKGTCGFLGLPRLEAVAHAGETLLGKFRDGVLPVTPEAVSPILAALDRIRMVLAGLGETGAEPAGDDSDVIEALVSLAEAPAAVAAEAPAEPDDPGLGRPLRPGEVSLAELEAAFNSVESEVDLGPPPTPVAEPESQVSPKADDETEAARHAQSIRVGVDVLEDMMTLVSELVLTRNQLLQINRQAGEGAFTPPLQRLSTITGELQDSVMKTRMQPIGAAWKKLPRLVRDLSRDLGKSIELVMEGEHTELDRQVLEQIRDPLTHMVRNSADHGLETPADRLAAGKPAQGRIGLSAFHQGGSIIIRIEDDGRGLNTERIRAKAVERGLATRAEAEAMTEAQVHRLIFAPGFSTAEAVTNVSGRGVGMDVVRTNIEEIGGQVDVASPPGAGTVFTIKIPLTLAIMPALIVGVAGQRFALPQASVLELVRAGEQAEHRIETLEGVRLLRLRERLIPLVDLAPAFGLGDCGRDESFVVVMQVGERRFGLTVADVFDTEEIVVKPLPAVLREAQLFSGATILGDGSVVLIVEPNALAALAGEAPASLRAEQAEANAWAEAEAPLTSLLLVRAGEGALKAVELSRLTRLEIVAADVIETIGARSTLQYRGRLTPVLPLAGAELRAEGVQPLLVFVGELYAMALAVDEIVDVVEDRLRIELNADRPGALGTAVVAGRAVEAIDIDHYLVRALAEHAKAKADIPQEMAA